MNTCTRKNAQHERNAEIVDMRLNKGMYYRYIAEKHDISIERVRQIVAKHERKERWRIAHE